MPRSIPLFLLKLAGALLTAWVVLIFGISLIYVLALARPACRRLPDPPPGYQDISLVSPAGVRLSGWWLPPVNGTAVILLGGHGASRDTMRPEAEMLARGGAGVLLLDARSCAGQAATLGVREIDDLRAAVNFAHSQEGVTRLGVLGFSAGAVTAIRGAARMPEIDLLLAEGNYANLWGEVANSGAPPLSLGWQFEHAVGLLLWPLVGEWPAAVDLRADLAALEGRPVLLIHGEREAGRNAAQAQYEAAGEPKALWIVPGADHGQYRRAAPSAYEQRLVEFFTTP